MRGNTVLRRFAAALAAVLALATASYSPTDTYAAVTMSEKDTMIHSGNEAAEDNNGCTSAHMFSTKMITEMCWDCVLPIIVGALPVASSLGGFKAGVPDGAVDVSLGSSMCMCEDPFGIPSLGLRTSLWEPFRLIELERMSGCSSVLNGIRFPFDKLNMGVDRSVSTGNVSKEASMKSKKHYHYYSYPIMTILDMWVPRNCNPGHYMDLDIMYMSEIDPTWNYDEIAFFTHPEAALIASPFGALACMPDAFMSQVGKPINGLYWCAGSWGVMFPTTGNVDYQNDMLGQTSLLSARVLYQLHRRAMEWRTMGRDAMCGGSIAPYLPKTQYRLSMFHPVAETDRNHAIGEHQLIWGIGRHYPVKGEDPVYVVWRWLDCCNTSSGGLFN
ncbi:MAG: TraU family protein [Duodenibacillus sp.]|nr:TraU family protein [Duodenibacillus sp.]